MFILMFFEEISVKIGFHRLGILTPVNPKKYPFLRVGPKALSCLLFPKIQKCKPIKSCIPPKNTPWENHSERKTKGPKGAYAHSRGSFLALLQYLLLGS
jgi:hypothetical protein